MMKNEAVGAGKTGKSAGDGGRRHILQSREWQEFEKLEGREVFEVCGEGWSARGIVEKTRAGKYLYAKYGPEITVGDEEGAKKAALVAALEGLRCEAERQGAIFVRIEPTERFSEAEMGEMGCVRSREIDPEHTWVLGLDREESEILAGMESNKVRSWRNAKKHGMRVRATREAGEIGILTRFLAGVGERAKFRPQEEAHLRRQMEAGFATLFIVEYSAKMEGLAAENGKNGGEGAKAGVDEADFEDFVPIAAALVYDYQGTRYYAHAGTDENYKKLRAGAVLLVEMILDAKKNGGRWFDFWGITTVDNPEHPWYGFTQFKKSFGGEQVDYTGTYDYVVDKMKYKVYKSLRKVNLMVRKLK